jgi:putative N-acetylmannosamine-6-phosphate epimerase
MSLMQQVGGLGLRLNAEAFASVTYHPLSKEASCKKCYVIAVVVGSAVTRRFVLQ